MKKRLWLIALGVLVLVGLVQSWPKPIDMVLQLERDRAEQLYPVAHADWENFNEHQVYLISPFGKHSPENHTQLLLSSMLVEEKLPANHIKVIRGDYHETELAGVRRLVFHESVYKIDAFTSRLISSRPIRFQHYHEKTGLLFTLGNLMSYYQSYVLDEVDRQLDPHPQKEKLLASFHLSPIEQGQETGYSSDGFQVKNGYLVFDLGVSIPMSKYYDVINPTYLEGDDLVDYETYKAKKNPA